MTAPAAPPREDRPRARTLELVLAHTHLRLGSLALARVELETLAGMGRLDLEGLVDLAEVRWRTGDLLGAGEAASAALRGDEGPVVVLVIAAEAAAALGRPTEARRLATLAMAKAPGSIDMIFAGMPRSSVWPGDAAEPPPTAPTLFDRDPEPVARTDVRGSTGHARPPTEPVPAAPAAVSVALGFWDAEPGIGATPAPMPDAGMELEAGRAALIAGSVDEAAFRFSLALRMAPALAPAVLEATSGARGTTLLVVRGDAFRLAGHEDEARQAYALAAHGGLPERRKRPRPRQESNLATVQGGADETGTDETGVDEGRTDEAGTDEAGTDETQTDEAGSDEAGSDEAGSDEAGSDEAATGEAGSDEETATNSEGSGETATDRAEWDGASVGSEDANLVTSSEGDMTEAATVDEGRPAEGRPTDEQPTGEVATFEGWSAEENASAERPPTGDEATFEEATPSGEHEHAEQPSADEHAEQPSADPAVATAEDGDDRRED